MAYLQRTYAPHGFTLLAFPCNQFGYQEPGSSECARAYMYHKAPGDYPIFDKVDVNGPGAIGLFEFIRSTPVGPRTIPWNFNKWLVNERGEILGHLGENHRAEEFEDAVRRLLGLMPLKEGEGFAATGGAEPEPEPEPAQ